MKKSLLKILLLLVLLTGISLVILFRDQLSIEEMEQQIRSAGILAPLLFMLIYIAGTVFFFPGSVLTLAGGALFGPVFGTFYNLIAATLGAMLSFLAAKYLAHDWVEKKAGGKLKAIKQGVESEGWKFVAFTRLVPLFPFNLLNYALGLTKIKFSHYSIATFVCMLPGAIAYTYVGYVGREALAGDEAVIQKVMIGIALLAVVSFLPSMVSKLRAKPMLSVNELKQKLDAGDEVLVLDVRTETEYNGEQGHINGSVLVPLSELKENIKSLENFQEKTVAIVCRTDKRSAKAARMLVREGFTDVHVVQNGMTGWQAAGYKVA